MTVSEILDGIYGTVTGENDWGHVVNAVSGAVPYARVLLHGQLDDKSYSHDAVCSDWDLDILDQYTTYFHTVSPWVSSHKSKKPGEVYLASEIVPDLSRDHPEFFNDWAIPASIGSGAAVKLFDSEHRFGVFTLDYEFERAELYDPVSLDFVKLLSPHFQRVMEISADLAQHDTGQNDLQTVLAKSQTASFVLSSSGRIEWINDAALEALRRGRGILQGSDGRLVLKHHRDNETFREIISRTAILSPHSMLGTPASMRFHVADEPVGPNLIHITHLCGSFSGSEAMTMPHSLSRRRVLVTIRYRSDVPVVLEDQLSLAFGFTAAEVRIVKALVADHSLSDIADQCGVSIHTVRGQMKSALAKTGCRRQSELVRLVMTMTGPGL